MELRLMHHYSTVVSSVMPDCKGQPAINLWQNVIPQLAFGSELVLNPMLALAALHYHSYSPGDSLMSFAATKYLDKTLVNHRRYIETFGSDLTEEIWVSAVILANSKFIIPALPISTA
jgi:hypothetical protein